MSREQLPRTFTIWLGASSFSALGDGVLAFALAWAASGIGPQWSGLVITMIVLPRVLLLLIGGAVADRWGPRQVMIVGYALMCAVAVVLAAAAHLFGVGPTLLILVALATGVIDAFYLPAMGSFPRLLVDAGQLPRALSLRQSASHIVGLLAAPVAGVLVLTGGITAAAAVNAITFAVVLLVLLGLRPRHDVAPNQAMRSVLREAVAGVRMVRADPTLTALLTATGMVAAFVLPMTALAIPLLAREHGWTASAAGTIVGAVAAGGLCLSLAVARWGMLGPPGLVAGSGSLLAGLGIAVIAVSANPVWAVAGGLIQGAGTALFVAHVAPLVIARTTSSHQARVQSLLGLAQTVPVLFANNVVALVATHAGITIAVLGCAVGTAAAGAFLLTRVQATLKAHYHP